jgi:site-specific recombinase XerD
VLYIAYCFEKNYAPSTIKLYIAGISFFHKVYSLNDPTDNFVIKKMLEGCKRLRTRQDYRAPISHRMLTKIITALKYVCSSGYEMLLFKTVFSLAYFGLFRVSELIVCSQMDTSRALTMKDVVFEKNTNALLVQLRITKTKQTGNPIVVRIPYNDETKDCIDSLRKYLSLIPLGATYFFCHANKTPLTRYQFSAVLSKACNQAGFRSDTVKTHSFRIGRATDLAIRGHSDSMIKQMGRWSSGSYLRYIRV